MIIQPRTGTAFILTKGQKLKVIDPQGQQVSDFICFSKTNYNEYFSSGRTMDYLSKIYVKKGDILYSNQSTPMVKIIEDTVNRHDILLTPCSKDTFTIIYKDKNPHRGCEGNLSHALKEFGINVEGYPSTFNIFMHVDLDDQGVIKVLPPRSKANDFIIIEALQDLVVGLTACSALQSNNGSFKPIEYEILEEDS